MSKRERDYVPMERDLPKRREPSREYGDRYDAPADRDRRGAPRYEDRPPVRDERRASDRGPPPPRSAERRPSDAVPRSDRVYGREGDRGRYEERERERGYAREEHRAPRAEDHRRAPPQDSGQPERREAPREVYKVEGREYSTTSQAYRQGEREASRLDDPWREDIRKEREREREKTTRPARVEYREEPRRETRQPQVYAREEMRVERKRVPVPYPVREERREARPVEYRRVDPYAREGERLPPQEYRREERERVVERTPVAVKRERDDRGYEYRNGGDRRAPPPEYRERGPERERPRHDTREVVYVRERPREVVHERDRHREPGYGRERVREMPREVVYERERPREAGYERDRERPRQAGYERERERPREPVYESERPRDTAYERERSRPVSRERERPAEPRYERQGERERERPREMVHTREREMPPREERRDVRMEEPRRDERRPEAPSPRVNGREPVKREGEREREPVRDQSARSSPQDRPASRPAQPRVSLPDRRGGYQGGARGGHGGQRTAGTGSLATNCYPLQIEEGMEWMLYGVTFDCPKMPPKAMAGAGLRAAILRRWLSELVTEVPRHLVECTESTVLCRHPLTYKDESRVCKGDVKTFSFTDRRQGAVDMRVKVCSISKVNINATVAAPNESSEQAISLLNRVTHLALRTGHEYQRIGSKYLVSRVTSKDLEPKIRGRLGRIVDNEAYVHRAFTLAVQPTVSGAMMVHEVNHQIRMNTSIDRMARSGQLPSPEQAAKDQYRVLPCYDQGTNYLLMGIEEKAFDERMTDDDTDTRTFREYYTTKFERPPRAPEMVYIYKWCRDRVAKMPSHVNMVKTRLKSGHDAWLIADLCFPVELSASVRGALPQVCGLKPDGKLKFMSSLASRLASVNSEKEHAMPPADVLKAWGVTVDKRALMVETKRLDEPRIQVSGARQQVTARDLRRSMQRMRLSGVELDSLGLFASDRADRRVVQEFENALPRALETVGIRVMKRPQLVVLPRGSGPRWEDDVINVVTQERHSVCVFMVDDNSKDLYALIKEEISGRKGIPTQFLNTKVQSGLQRQRGMITSTLATQIGAKLGHPVWQPTGTKDLNALVVGIDVWHGQGNNGRSIVGFGGYDFRGADGLHTSGGLSEHPAKQEVLSHIQAGTYEPDTGSDALYHFVDRCLGLRAPEGKAPTCKPPDTVIVFRDGTSQGQLEAVRKQELSQVHRALAKYRLGDGPDLKPVQVVYCVCVKRSGISMVATKESDFQAATDGRAFDPRDATNAPTGAVVIDPRILRNPETEFFLFSVGTSPSTSRAVHYHIVESGGMARRDICNIAYNLSFQYFNWPGPVLVPGPIQYATKAAYLAGECFKGLISDEAKQTGLYWHRGLAYL
ncbi:hypothetical protein KIPB_001285 [Kipferlia bialata]|uniref:Piwi domain-containing protein n=1 Tax=Kipferlia bialata TaxID=797122 RepID=A0A9K3CQB9_9EUKA|nr:hypothetical protein KIPB_001285 [Kipferlia bialata]|eukprot:g1285.t1